jgi:hypothetical protein
MTAVGSPLKDRPLSDAEMERMRLILSTFRDGGGQVVLKKTGESMPGFRDFERAVAAVCGGQTREDKGVFDVLVPDTGGGLPYGVSCKMSKTQPLAHAASFMELTNSAKKFSDEFARLNLSWVHNPAMAGNAFVELVSGWHLALSAEVDVPSSRYLVLSHDAKWEKFQLHSFPLSLKVADPATEVEWAVEGKKAPSSINGYIDHNGRRHRLWQLYPNSGGQLKYYPPRPWATWSSGAFRLEQPPAESLADRADEYFPEAWRATQSGS